MFHAEPPILPPGMPDEKHTTSHIWHKKGQRLRPRSTPDQQIPPPPQTQAHRPRPARPCKATKTVAPPPLVCYDQHHRVGTSFGSGAAHRPPPPLRRGRSRWGRRRIRVYLEVELVGIGDGEEVKRDAGTNLHSLTEERQTLVIIFCNVEARTLTRSHTSSYVKSSNSCTFLRSRHRFIASFESTSAERPIITTPIG